MVKNIPVPQRDLAWPPYMTIIRSFDVNKPGYEIDDVRGRLVRGTIVRGVLKLNWLMEVSPGIVEKDKKEKLKCMPLYSWLISLFAEENELQFADPGGLIGIGTMMHPALIEGNGLVGQVLGDVGSLPDVIVQLAVNFFLLKRYWEWRIKQGSKSLPRMRFSC